jgi:predicted transcriptional regulator
MGRRNLTIQLDDDLVRRAKVLAAKRGTSVSGLVAHELDDMISADERYEAAMQQELDAMANAQPRGGRHWRREDLYDR